MDTIGPYRIGQTLLTTSFSDIYIVYAEDDDIPLALKVFHPKNKNVGSQAKYGPDFWRARFVEEGRLLNSIDHPHIIPVVDTGVTLDGAPFFVMPFMEANLSYEIGEDVSKAEDKENPSSKWRSRPISPRRAVEIWDQVLNALSELHVRGLVHRDIKPPNILLDKKMQGRVRLADFGMVKVPDSRGSRSGIWIGTLDYISPEQRKSAKDVDQRSDVYSAGALMYRMLTGELPGQRPVPLRAGRLDIPACLGRLIGLCLKRRPSDRPADAGVVHQRLIECVPDFTVLSSTSKLQRRAKASNLIIHKKIV